MKYVRCGWSRECVVDRQLTATGCNVLFGRNSSQIVAGGGHLGCVAPYRHHCHLGTGVTSSRLVTSQRHSARFVTYPTAMSSQVHKLTGVNEVHLPDFGIINNRQSLS